MLSVESVKISPLDQLIQEIFNQPSLEYHVTRPERDKVGENSRGRSLHEDSGFVVSRHRSERSINVNSILNSIGFSFLATDPDEKCGETEDKVVCDVSARYRRHDGRCNNLDHPYHGAADTAQPRLRPGQYGDGVSSPRQVSVSARRVSQGVHHDRGHGYSSDQGYSLMLMQWGQFLDHDITLVPMLDPGHQCEQCHGYNPDHCYPIPVSHQDSFYSGSGAPQCIPFRRSVGRLSDVTGQLEQLNVLSSHVDGSQVYGSNQCDNDRLRHPRLTHLLRTDDRHASMLPVSSGVPDCRGHGDLCFLAGDVRANEQPGLTSLHTILVRQHNTIARSLAAAQPAWSQEKVYQEARRIVIAILQHITFAEFLPRILGPDTMDRFNLNLHQLGYYKDYSPNCSTAVFNEFSAAAFRFGHSMIQPVMTLMSDEEMMEGMSRSGEHHHHVRRVSLRHHFHNPALIMDSQGAAVDDIVRGMMVSPMSVVDRMFTKEVTNHLFEEKRKRFSGLDLVALNIQRGRDHGIGGYNDYREVCGLERLVSWNDSKDIPKETLKMMSKVYDAPDDVDLFTGLMSERLMEQSMVGPTLGCLLGLQFSRLRQCDRFWYETSDPRLRFSQAQLTMIRGVTLSSLLCSGGGDTMHHVTRSVFDLHHPATNPMLQCGRDIAPLDLGPWMDTSDSCPVETMTGSPCSRCQCSSAGDVCTAKCADLINMFGLDTVKRDCQDKCRVK